MGLDLTHLNTSALKYIFIVRAWFKVPQVGTQHSSLNGLIK